MTLHLGEVGFSAVCDLLVMLTCFINLPGGFSCRRFLCSDSLATGPLFYWFTLIVFGPVFFVIRTASVILWSSLESDLSCTYTLII